MNANVSRDVKRGWSDIKKHLSLITDRYSLTETIEILKKNSSYKEFYGKAKNRTLTKKNPILYLSIYDHTSILEKKFKKQKSWSGSYNFKFRIKFLVECDGNIKKLKCECGKKYTWTGYCRRCPAYHVTWAGKKHSTETKRKQRISALNYLESTKGQIVPRYNTKSIKIIEEYGKQYGYNFKHAENGGEFYIKELGYFVDGYDVEKNVILEIDEKNHFDNNGKLKEKDQVRQLEIEKLLKCKFIRIKI
jgi:very-short-patch-repair endonuclease